MLEDSTFFEMFCKHAQWSDATFGKGKRSKGIINHLKKELVEVEENFLDPFEWADVVLLAFDGLRRLSGGASAAVEILREKMEINFARDYPFPESEDHESEHVRTKEYINILQKANEYIHGERVGLYGTPIETFPQAAIIASLITGKDITATDLCLCVIAMKLIRARYSPDNPDHNIDICGYMGIKADIEQHLKGVVNET